MNGPLAVDFGTSNTLFAVWDSAKRDAQLLDLPDYSQTIAYQNEVISIVPSLINYAQDNRQWIGNQVILKNLQQSNHTFRWMKRYINHRSPIQVQINDRTITPQQAGHDYLASLLSYVIANHNLQEQEVGFSVPVESFEHYQNWLTQIAVDANVSRFRFIDEPSAAALGYDTSIQPGHAYLIFDMGGGTMHAAVVLVEDKERINGRRCRVMGKSGRDVGGSNIDQWLFQEVLGRYNRKDFDPDIRRISNQLLVECEKAKLKLSSSHDAEICIEDPVTNSKFTVKLTRSEFEDILDQNNIFAEINTCIQSAISSAKERGYSPEAIHSVLMVGGGSQIPAIQRSVRQIFGKDRVHCSRPMDAIIRGTAAFIGGVDFFDHIQHDYAIRHLNSTTGQYEYRTIVNHGTSYPTKEPVAEIEIKATYDGQQQLGVLIYELGVTQLLSLQTIELVFDPSGAARLMQVTPQQQEERSLFCMNEKIPTFLEAVPPAAKGQPRFRVEFYIDSNKRLTLSARDLLNGQLILHHHPVVKLV